MKGIKLLIVTEGEKTEPNYLKELIDSTEVNNKTIKILDSKGRSAPHTLIQKAINLKKDFQIEEVWVVMDTEYTADNPTLKKAFRLADTFNIKIAISNPSFEYWILLHYGQNLTQWSSPKELKQTLSRKIGQKYTKARLPNKLIEKVDLAISNAEEGRKKRNLSAEKPKDFLCSPFSNLDILIKKIRGKLE